MPFAHIAGTGSAVPDRILDNQAFEKFIDTTDEWIVRRTGIKQRHIARPEETPAVMGLRAARAALKSANITADQIDSLIAGTVTSELLFPSCACLIQKELEANNASAFDVAAGCSGFLYALEIANNSIKAGMAKTVLVVGTERLSTVLDWHDRSTCVLLGDGAGAVVLRSHEEPGGILSTHVRSDGRLWDLLYAGEGNTPPPEIIKDIRSMPFHVVMEGNRLFKKAVPSMAQIAEIALSHNGLTHDDIQLVIPHQANLRIIQAVSEKLKIPMEKFYTNVDRFGNTSSGSIPLALDEVNREKRLAKGDNILMVSFGAGLTWGAAVIKWGI